MVTTPKTTYYHSDCVRECRELFFVPGIRTNRLGLSLDQVVGHQSSQRKQPDNRRRRVGDRQFVPLPLSFHAKMRPGLLKSHFQPPSDDKPADYLLARMMKTGRKQGMRFKLARRITDQQSANWNWRASGAMPDCRLGVDFYYPVDAAIPMVDLDPRPAGVGIFEHLLWRWSPCALEARTTGMTGPSFRRRAIQLRIQTQFRDQIDSRPTARQIEQIEHNKSAVADKNQVPQWIPALDQSNHLPSLIGQLLMLLSGLGVIAFQGAQHSQKRQSLDTFGPLDRNQQHTAQTTQAARIDQMRTGRTNRGAVDPPGFDFLPASPLGRIVQTHDQFAFRDEDCDNQSQQHLAGFDGRPSRPVQDSIKVLKVLFLALAHHAQASGDGPFAGNQNGPDQQLWRFSKNVWKTAARRQQSLVSIRQTMFT